MLFSWHRQEAGLRGKQLGFADQSSEVAPGLRGMLFPSTLNSLVDGIMADKPLKTLSFLSGYRRSGIVK